MPQMPDLPVDVDDVADRLKDITGAATTAARQAATTTVRQTKRMPRLTLPGVLVGLVALVGVFFLVRSRRPSSDPDI